MIDVDKTIYKNVLDVVNRMRYQADSNKNAFKAILQLIFVNDMIEWASQEPEEVKEKLHKIQQQLILCNAHITPEYEDTSLAYTNVNTPQTTDTWKRVWDSDNAIKIPSYEKYIPCSEDGCKPARVYEVGLGTVKDFFAHSTDATSDWIQVELGTLKNLI